MNREYKKYLASNDWKNKRLLKLGRKGWSKKRCAVCGQMTNLEVHHLIYRNDLKKVTQTDLRILCKRCHKLSHKLLKNGKLKYKNENHHSRFALLQWAIKRHLKRGFRSEFIKANESYLDKKGYLDIKRGNLELDNEFRAIVNNNKYLF